MYEETPIYQDNDGARLSVRAGGTVRLLTGALQTVAAGAAIKIEAGGELQDNDGNAYNLGAGIATATDSTQAELDRLHDVVPGAASASKAAVLGADMDLDELHLAALHLGAGAGTQVTATAAELNDNDISARTQAITEAGAIDLDARHATLAGPAEAGTYAVTLAAPARAGITKIIEMTSGAADKTVTLALTEVVGGSAAATATFDAAGEILVLVSAGAKWVVLKEVGVTLT